MRLPDRRAARAGAALWGGGYHRQMSGLVTPDIGGPPDDRLEYEKILRVRVINNACSIFETCPMPYRNRLKALLSKGYFPNELPSVFTTEDFGEHIVDILVDWRKGGVFSKKSTGKIPQTKKLKRDSYGYKVDPAEIEIISKPKRGYERRNIHITHPVPQALLSLEITKNWSCIQKWLLRQEFSLDEIRIDGSYRRSIKGINFEIHKAKKGYIEATSDWLVKTDITRFYPTIYTHSIAWAAYGKERVKTNLKLYEGSLADRLDLLVRSCNRNQTIGIPIGPETSRIIAEVISSRIDADFQVEVPNIAKERVDRLQDDWFIGVDKLEDAERALSAISSVYRNYGLEINGSKTSIDRLIGMTGSHWVSEISAFLSHRPGPARGPRLKEFLALSLRLQAAFPAEPVINYALSIVESQDVAAGDVESLESFLLKAAVISPISMDRICRIILNIDHKTKRISSRRIGARFTKLSERNLENGNIFEVIWLLYTLRGLKVPLYSKRISEIIENTASSSLGLILLDMQSKGLCIASLPKDMWVSKITKERVSSDWIWLLAYEGIRHGWLNDPSKTMASPFFRAMASRDIVFYDPKRNIPTSKSVNKERKRQRRKNIFDVQQFIRAMRGFNFGEY